MPITHRLAFSGALISALLIGSAALAQVTQNKTGTGTATTMATPTPISNVQYQPGQWEFTRTMVGGPRRDVPGKVSVCFTSEHFATDPAMIYNQNADRSGPQCAVTNATMVGDQLSYVTTCSLPFGKMVGNWSGKATPTGFTSNAQMAIMGRSVQATLVGQRVGDCLPTQAVEKGKKKSSSRTRS